MALMRMLLGLGAVLLVAGCGGRPREPAPAIPAEVAYRRAMQQYRRGDCKHAREGLGQVTAWLSPRDTLVALALYYQAECDFAGGLYLEASRQFRRVADEHAASRVAPDALLRAGDAQAELWKHPELDPEYGQAAMTTYRELVARFPESPAAARARIKLAALTDKFAEKEYRNGLFYFRLKAYDSAILYFRSVVADYPQSRVAPLALLKLVRVYGVLDYQDERRETCDHLRRYYPQTAGLAAACPPADQASSR
jgi:outer membrane protein assembly factor BamD